MLLLWRSWFIQNQITHEGPKDSVEHSIHFLRSYGQQLSEIRQHSDAGDSKGKAVAGMRSANPSRNHLRWEKPQSGYVKLNVDTAFFEQSGLTGLGIVARNEKGEVILAAHRLMTGCSDAEEAELMACKEGLKLAFQWIDEPIVLETDCLSVCKAIKSKEDNIGQLMFSLQEVVELIDEHFEVVIQHCRRDQNRVAHFLVQSACKELSSKVWIRHIPEVVAPFVADDCNFVLS
ncbi:hypothetical protein C2845_PM03G31700 [Panicum miliaceum]|uniref:RNase H type-1 domain-containing protein n=1 Tax=Panicum miliaceum TaxID=4540 RepID=A0A3L6T7U7_PANMI|nr:hypothetical protein C2845_PM03G31700 [Panicum miliaceum]